MKWLSVVNAAIRGLLNAVVVVSVIGLAGTMTVQVILRYFLQWPLMGVEEMSTLSGLWLYFSGIALVSVQNKHICGGLFSNKFSDKIQNISSLAVFIICAIICLYFFLLSIDYIQFVLDVNRRSTYLRWPTALWVASLCLGMLLSAVAFIIRAILTTRKLRP